MFAPETERLMESRFRAVDARYAGIDLLASTAESGRAEQVIFGWCVQILHLPRLNKRPSGVECKCCGAASLAKLQPLAG